MDVSAVPQIREDMVRVGERRITNTESPFPAHLGKGRSRPIHELGEIMAADARQRAAALRNYGGSVMRAARTEIGGAAERHDIAAQLPFLRLEKGEPFGNARGRVKAGNALGYDSGDLSRCQLAVRGKYPVAVFVELADDAGANVFTPIVELLLELVLDDGPFLLDDENFLEPLGKMPDALALQRPGHRNLVEAEADLRGMLVVNPEIVERLAHVEVGFAGSDDSEARPGTIDDDAVEPIGACESQCRVKLVFMQPEFLIERLIGPANIQSPRRHLEIVGEHDFGALRVDLDRGRTVDSLGDRLKGYPTPGVARHRPAIEAEIEDFLHSRWV